MKITIDPDVLSKYNLSLGQFIILLTGYYNLNCQEIKEELLQKGLVSQNLFKEYSPILSDNTKDMVTRIIIESDDKLHRSKIKDFEDLAGKLQAIYPPGNKPGTTYSWRGDIHEIAQQLRTLVVIYDFDYTVEEAIAATKEYVQSFKNYKYMRLLRNFLLTNKKGNYADSLFMTIIENNREQERNQEDGGDIGDLEDALG